MNALKLIALNTLLSSAQQSLEAVKNARTAYIYAVNERKEVFTELPRFMTRVVNMLAATDASPEIVKDARAIRNRFYIKTKKVMKPAGTDTSEETPIVTRSRSYTDYDNKAHNFELLVRLLINEPNYDPNEPELTITGLMFKAKQLHMLNSAVIQAQINLSNLRMASNQLLYAPIGIHGLGLAVKRYVKGVFGYNSSAYKQISGIEFVSRKGRI
jgi:hypothetical protein